jgi:uncharacterized protein
MTQHSIFLHVVPGAARSEIVGWVCDAAGRESLKVRINAPAEDGKANKALVKFLAKQWKVSASTLVLARGAASRHKQLMIHSETLYRHISVLYRGIPAPPANGPG